MTCFSEFNLDDLILKGLEDLGFKTTTPIQSRAIPFILQGKDFLGIAQTGTGKTAAFAVPILHKLIQSSSAKQCISPQVLVLVPTRELAAQAFKNFKSYGKYTYLKMCAIFGGVNEKPQIRELKNGTDVLIATPGRLLDLYQRKIFSMKGIRFCVLDEADRMLDMGFLPAVRTIMKEIPSQHQTLLFSATFPKEIEILMNDFLKEPVRVDITPPTTAAVTVDQSLIFVPQKQKQELLHHILGNEACERILVFSKTKYGADRISRNLRKANLDNYVLHGDKSQRQRQRALKHFQQGDIKILVATDVASRGIDITNITHVINFDLPDEPESYIHRVGRTGRAGNSGTAFSFCDVYEKRLLRAIEKKLQERIPVISAKRFWPDFQPEESKQPAKKRFRRKYRSKK